jgi:hypothetical protein
MNKRKVPSIINSDDFDNQMINLSDAVLTKSMHLVAHAVKEIRMKTGISYFDLQHEINNRNIILKFSCIEPSYFANVVDIATNIRKKWMLGMCLELECNHKECKETRREDLYNIGDCVCDCISYNVQDVINDFNCRYPQGIAGSIDTNL